jgi:N-acetylglutamate synthase
MRAMSSDHPHDGVPRQPSRAAPTRRHRSGATHRGLSVDDLQRVMVGAWPAVETASLGDWLLRASSGFTHRGNSVMTAGSPGCPLEAAVDVVELWYGERGLPSDVSVAGPVGWDLAADPLATVLLGRGYAPRVTTRTLTAATDTVAASASRAAAPGGLALETRTSLDEEWLDAYRGYREAHGTAARAVLTGSPAQDFAVVRTPAGDVVAIGRLGVAHGWGGIAAMWVDPSVRRTGVATAVLGALAERALDRRVRSLHLQADTDNEGAQRLYRRHGFTPHHDYVNLRRGRRSEDQPPR